MSSTHGISSSSSQISANRWREEAGRRSWARCRSPATGVAPAAAATTSPACRWSHWHGRGETEGFSRDRCSSPTAPTPRFAWELIAVRRSSSWWRFSGPWDRRRISCPRGRRRSPRSCGGAQGDAPVAGGGAQCERTATPGPMRRTWAGTVSTRRTPPADGRARVVRTGKNGKRTKCFLHNGWHCG
jgi:hypothetical protein